MSAPTQENQAQDNKPSDKELNFRRLEQKYQQELAQERAARIEAERINQERSKVNDDDDDEPYVDKKRLNKTLAQFGQQTKQETETVINKAVQTALHEERKQNWLKSNGDFYDVLNHAEKLANHDPELAESILAMPDNFERQKLVYKNIKALGLHKEKEAAPSIQQKIDANRKSPYYQPSGVGSAPYSNVSDYSQGGQKQAYEKMQQLKAQLRL